ncbi:MAG TPA: serine hydrolase [Bacteroidia bacterium]|nr:serine hydrolase [Bacteroidia bacterium]
MKNSRRYLLPFAVLFASFFALSLTNEKSAPAAQPAFITDSLDTYITREMKNWDLPGLAVAVVKDGQVVVSKGYGVTEMGTDKKVNDESLFMIASCTKAFTATSLAVLGQEKKLSLNDSVVKWLPGFHMYDPAVTPMVTIRDLLCHRLGFQTFQGDFLNWDSNLSRAQIIDAIGRNKPVFGFRAQYGYCNAAFLTAGEIIPKATGKSWDDFVKERFFIPLKMTRSSTTHDVIAHDANACVPHTRWNGKETKIAYDVVDNLGPAASVNSCVKDLSHWLLMQLDSGRYGGNHIVPFAALAETRKPQTIIENRNPDYHFVSYCLGWTTADYHGKQLFWHNGGASGFLSTVCFIPELNLGIVVLANSDNNNLFNALRQQIIDAYMGLPYKNYSALYLPRYKKFWADDDAQVAKWNADVAKNPKLPVDLQAFAGMYENPVYGKMNVVVEENKLSVSFEHHPNIIGKLEYMGDSTMLCTFFSPLWGIKPAPFVIKDGKVESITISVNGEVDAMPYEFRHNDKP